MTALFNSLVWTYGKERDNLLSFILSTCITLLRLEEVFSANVLGVVC